jgi:hypothetical protein
MAKATPLADTSVRSAGMASVPTPNGSRLCPNCMRRQRGHLALRSAPLQLALEGEERVGGSDKRLPHCAACASGSGKELIERHAQDNPPLSLDDPTIVQAGARAFSERGCLIATADPAWIGPNSPKACTRAPPDLKELANETSPQELFWVIKNGINMTGMPSFGAIEVTGEDVQLLV